MWAKVCDTLTFHPKILAAGNQAVGVWVRLLAWSCGQGTDGFVPKAMADVTGNVTDYVSLTRSGLLHEVDGGYVIHDFSNYQPSRASVQAEKARKAKNVADFRSRRSCVQPVVLPVTSPVTLPVDNRGVTTARTRTQEEFPPALRADPQGEVSAVAKRQRKAPEPKPDISADVLTEREKLIRDAIVSDETLSPIVPAPNRLARDLLAACPGIDIPREVKGAGAWIRSNPERAKSKGGAYLLNWCKRAQDSRGGRTTYTTPGYRAQPTLPAGQGWKAKETTEATVEVNDDDIPY